MKAIILLSILSVVAAAPAKRCARLTESNTAGGVDGTAQNTPPSASEAAALPTSIQQAAAWAVVGDHSHSAWGGAGGSAGHWASWEGGHDRHSHTRVQSQVLSQVQTESSSQLQSAIVTRTQTSTAVQTVHDSVSDSMPTTQADTMAATDTDIATGDAQPTTNVLVVPTPSPNTEGTNAAPTTPIHSTASSAVVTSVSSNPAVTATTVTPTTLTRAASTTTAGSSGGSGSSGNSGAGTGLGLNNDSGSKISSVEGKLAWYCDWSLAPLPNMGDLEFVPQVHDLGSLPGVATAAASWPAGVKYVLSFNEPDMGTDVGGSNIAAAEAATQHQAWVSTLGGSYSIGSPAVARGSKKWMDDWVAACAGACKYDFVPFHFYGTSADDLIAYAKDFHTTYNKPLWLTEWSCRDYSAGVTCTDDQVKTFMNTAISWFRGEGSGIVERWAYFGAFTDMAAGGNPNGLLATDGSANAMGNYYVSL